MSLLRRVRPVLARLARKLMRRDLDDDAADEVRDELDFYLDMRTRELIDGGVPAEMARRRAQRAFGDRDTVAGECRRLTAEQHRRGRRARLAESLFRDVVSAARALRRQPLITAAAVLILATGFAATSVVYGLVDALLIRSLSVPQAERLVALYNHSEEAGYFSSVSYPDFLDYRAVARSVTDLAGYGTIDVILGGDAGQPIRATAHAVTSGYFQGLGIVPAAGSLFGSEDPDTRGRFDTVVVISHALWQQRFGGAPGAVGGTVTVNGISATIAGVAPRGFRGVDKETIADLWMPIGLYAELTPGFAAYLYDGRGAHWLTVLGRLADGATMDDARAELTVLSVQQAEAYPDTNAEWRIRLFEAGAGVIWPERREGIVALSGTLMAGVVLVLLIAGANVANLLLVRASGRRAELGMRLALGAGRARLVRQLLTESLLLAIAGGACGLLLAGWIRAALSGTVVPADFGHLLEAGAGGHAVAVTAGVALLAGLAFGLVPALRASRPDLMAALRDQGRGSSGGRSALGNGLVVAQIALSLPLLVGAVLIGRSLWNQLTVDLGMSTDDLLVVAVEPAAGGYGQEQEEEIYARLRERVTAMPGVVDAAYTKVVPLARMRMATDVRIPGRTPAGDDAEDNVEVNIISPGYPATSGMPLLRGRDFSPRDTSAGAPVLMINQVMAERHWPAADPVGETVEVSWFDGVGLRPVQATVVGVLADHGYGRVRAEQVQLSEPAPRVYLPLSQTHQTSMTLLVRTSTGAAALARPVIETMRELSPATPDVEVVSFRQHVARLLPQQRLVAGLLTIASGIGLFLASIGIYAVMAYSVSRRAHEMGIRRALGAQRGDVMRLVVRESLTLCLLGIGLGALAALASTRMLASMLYGVGAADPASYLGVAAIVIAVSLLASYLPARDAAGSDPRSALRRP